MVIDLGHERLLDIPEGVLGHSAQHFHESAGLRTMAECIAHVLNSVVFVASLDGRKFPIEDLIPLISNAGVLTKLIVKGHTKGTDIPFFLRQRFVLVGTFEFTTHNRFVKAEL